MTTADFMVIAHWGASAYAPENTLVAFDLALQMGCRHMAEIRAYAPELPTDWLVSEVGDTTLAQAHEPRLTQICPRATASPPPWCAACMRRASWCGPGAWWTKC